MRDRRLHDWQLDQFWDALVRGEPELNGGGLDPEEANVVRAFQRLAQAPIAAHSSRIDWRSAASRNVRHVNPEAVEMDISSHWKPAPYPARTEGTAPRMASSPALGRPWASARVAFALLLMLTLVLSYFVVRQTRPAAVNSVVATPTMQPTAGAWPDFGGDPARTRAMPGPGPKANPVVLWTYPAKNGGDLQASIDRGAVADGVVYMPTNTGSVVAVEAATGKQLWEAKGYGNTVVVDGDGLIVQGNPNKFSGSDLARLKRSDGSMVWTSEVGRIAQVWNPVVADGVGYIPSKSDFIAFDPKTGAVLWRTPLATAASRGAAVGGGMAVLGDIKGKLYAISLKTHAIIATYETGFETIAHPSIGDGVAFVGAFGGASPTLFEFDLSTLRVIWRFSPSDAGQNLSNVAIGPALVYVATQAGSLYALDIKIGAVKWRAQAGSASVGSPSLVDGVIYFNAGDGLAHAVDAENGAKIWEVELDSTSGSASIVVGGVLYLSTDLNTLYAIGGAASTPAAPVTATPTIA